MKVSFLVYEPVRDLGELDRRMGPIYRKVNWDEAAGGAMTFSREKCALRIE